MGKQTQAQEIAQEAKDIPATMQEQQMISKPADMEKIKEMGKDAQKLLMQRMGLEVEYADKTERPARCLTKSGEMRRLIAACLIKTTSKKISVVIGNAEPCTITAENVEGDYLKFARKFEEQAQVFPLCVVNTKTFIRPDNTRYQRAYIRLAKDAPIFAKEEVSE